MKVEHVMEMSLKRQRKSEGSAQGAPYARVPCFSGRIRMYELGLLKFNLQCTKICLIITWYNKSNDIEEQCGKTRNSLFPVKSYL